MNCKNIQKIKNLEAKLQGASPAETASIVKKLVKLKDNLFNGK